MATPQETGAGPVVVHPWTGDYRIDTVLGGLDLRWNAGAPLGTPVVVSYGFMAAPPAYGGADAEGGSGFSVFNDAQRAAVRQILERLQAELGIRFTEADEAAGQEAQIRFGNNSQPGTTGYAWLPHGVPDARAGDVWINHDFAANLAPAPGSRGWAVLLHEIGHALGLKHSGNHEAGEVDSGEPGNYLGTAEDHTGYTVMSYREPTDRQPRDWYGMYDLLALKALYGSDRWQEGDTVHRFGDAAGQVLGIVHDSGGIDTIDLSALGAGAVLDLRPGAFSSVGRVAGRPAIDNLSIELTSIVENVVGSAHGDFVTGNEAANRFTLGLGNNRAEGGGGIDTAVYAGGAAEGFRAAASGGTIRVTGPGISDLLSGVERLELGGSGLAFDLQGHAGYTAAILGAVFGPQALREPSYVGTGLALFDAGMDLDAVIRYALDARLGPGWTAAGLVRTLYTNVLGEPPSAAEQAGYEGLLADGSFDAVSLTRFAAASAANLARIDFTGLQENGLAYA